MQQRRLRLGDILDDYCPRERRVTNHAVVAIVGDDVRQTRCTTCNADHDYRHGKAPASRRPKSAESFAADGGEGARPVLAAPQRLEPEPDASEAEDIETSLPKVGEHLQVPLGAASDAAEPLPLQAVSTEDPAESSDPTDPRDDDGPVHRRLIRATFPRPEGQVPERRETEFTVRQPGSRGGEVDGNRTGFRSRGPQGQSGFGGPRNVGRQQFGGGLGSDGQRGGRGPGGNRPGGGGFGRGPRQGGGAGRKGGR